MPCAWTSANGSICTLPGQALVNHDGSDYCQFHLPRHANQKPPSGALNDEFRRLQHAGQTDFRGISFPGSVDANPEPNARYDIDRNIDLSECIFSERVDLVIGNGDVNLSASKFLGTAAISLISPGRTFACRQVEFRGPLVFSAGSHKGSADFSGTTFMSSSLFVYVDGLGTLNFSRCAFLSAPTFSSRALPQRTIFSGAQFRPLRAEDEGAYRAIRNYFNANRARDLEGQFYAKEKRCQRLGMHGLREWVPCAISRAYDWTSEYGYSYGRALFWFCFLQIACGLAYAYMAGLVNIGGAYDSRVVAFTFGQLAKPFELFASNPPGSESAYSIIPQHGSGLWQLLTAAQSVLSFALLGLLFLALRWRFRRE